jgi:hypothetical protein
MGLPIEIAGVFIARVAVFTCRGIMRFALLVSQVVNS